jgi:hypothetical protein
MPIVVSWGSEVRRHSGDRRTANRPPEPLPPPSAPHWGVENRLRWVLDVVPHDDLARLRTSNGPQNLALVKRTAINLVRNPNDKHSLKVRRKLANLNPDYLEALIKQNAPLT